MSATDSPADRRPRWRDLSDAERAIEYSPSSCLDGRLDPYLEAYAQRSADAYRQLEVVTLPYGDSPTQTIDIARPATGDVVGLHLFIHGGYWQQLSKRESFFLAPAIVASGTAFGAVDYTLAPDASLSAIVAECVAALRRVRAEADRLGIDPTRIVVSGSSAGAQLAAMTSLHLSLDERPAGVILVSGIYALEPLLGTYINDAVGMDRAEALANSALEQPGLGFPPAVLAWGENETAEFKRQSRAMADHLSASAVATVEIEVPDRNHFDVVFDIVPLFIDALATLGG